MDSFLWREPGDMCGPLGADPMPKKTSRVVQCHRDLTQLACVHLHGKRVRENPNVAAARNFVGDIIL